MQASSDNDVVSALNAFADQLVPGALRELAVAWPDLRDHAPGNLRDVIAERLRRPEFARLAKPGESKPLHPPGSVKAIAAEMRAARGQGAGGGFGTRPVGLEPLPTTPGPARPAGPSIETILVNRMANRSFGSLPEPLTSTQIRVRQSGRRGYGGIK
jgi:hypothetical protein